jgi:hypothetical protein
VTANYERLATDGDGDVWGYSGDWWACISDSATADDDAGLERQYPPVTFYAPAPPPCAVTYDLSDPDVRHVLTQALEDYAAKDREMAENGAGESFARWADLADEMCAQAEAAG